MTELVLTRWWTDCMDAQVGRLVYPGGSCYTLEDRWRWNRVGESCIPLGFYDIERDTFRGQYPNFAVRGVVGRSAIELHRGNTDEDTRGCILLGRELRFNAHDEAFLVDSRPAFDAFMEAMDGIDHAMLTIVDLTQRPVVWPVAGGG